MQNRKKLTILQNGFLHALLTIPLVMYSYILPLTLILYVYKDNPPQTLFASLPAIVSYTSLTMLIGYGIWLFSTRLNLVFPVTLPKVIELSHAMGDLHVVQFDKQVDFLAEKKINLYVSPKSLIIKQEENLAVKKFIFLQNRKKLKFYNGDNRLCLDFDDYEQLLREQKEFSSFVNAKQSLAYKNEIETLKAANALLHEDMTKVTQEKTACCTELAEFKKKQQTVSARDAKADKREHDRVVFWRVAAPMINRLLAEAGPKTLYTRPQIQAAFEEELKNFPQLQASIATLLETPKKKVEGKSYDLEGWGMDIIRKSLGEYVKK